MRNAALQILNDVIASLSIHIQLLIGKKATIDNGQIDFALDL